MVCVNVTNKKGNNNMSYGKISMGLHFNRLSVPIYIYIEKENIVHLANQ